MFLRDVFLPLEFLYYICIYIYVFIYDSVYMIGVEGSTVLVRREISCDSARCWNLISKKTESNF